MITGKRLHFVLSDTDALQQAVTDLSATFHVVPSAVPDTDPPLLAVEVDEDHLDLVVDVRTIVQTADPLAKELHESR